MVEESVADLYSVYWSSFGCYAFYAIILPTELLPSMHSQYVRRIHDTHNTRRWRILSGLKRSSTKYWWCHGNTAITEPHRHNRSVLAAGGSLERRKHLIASVCPIQPRNNQSLDQSLTSRFVHIFTDKTCAFWPDDNKNYTWRVLVFPRVLSKMTHDGVIVAI